VQLLSAVMSLSQQCITVSTALSCILSLLYADDKSLQRPCWKRCVF